MFVFGSVRRAEVSVLSEVEESRGLIRAVGPAHPARHTGEEDAAEGAARLLAAGGGSAGSRG